MSPQPRPFRLRIHLLALAACVCLLTGVLVPARSYADELEPIQSENAWANDYSTATYGVTLKSALTTDESGNLQRVEYVDNKLIVETYQYNSAYHVKDQRIIDPSTYTPSNLDSENSVIWGGYFSGSDANFVVTGQQNINENSNLPVLRVTKYTKGWDYLLNYEYKDINTTIPFYCGSCSMTELDGKLYIKSCHIMNKTEDGLNHQASMYFVINETNMQSLEAYTGISDSNGYTSHSMDQHLAVLGSSVYSVDLGDAYPRSVVMRSSKDEVGHYIFPQKGISIIKIKGDWGDNSTFTTVGGIATSDTSQSILTVGTQRDQDKVYDFDNWGDIIPKCPTNVWLTVTNANLTSSNRIELTNFTENSHAHATNPQIVKVSNDEFLILWGEVTMDNDDREQSRKVAYKFINGKGETTKETQTFEGSLSDCQPIVMNNKVIWYANGPIVHWSGTDYRQIPIFYTIDLLEKTMVPTGDASQLANATVIVTKWTAHTPDMVYTGYPITPEVYVYFGGIKLTEGKEYGLTFSDNIDSGVATVTITGLDSYRGQHVVKHYEIKKKDINHCYPKYREPVHSYNGQPQYIVPLVNSSNYNINRIYLKEGVDYTVTYTNNINAGTASYTYVGKGNYTGVLSGTFIINKAVLTDNNTWFDSVTYTGEPIIPEVNLYGIKLDPSEYTITCTNNINAGTATATITGTGKNVEGTLVKDFIIGQGDLYYAKIAPIPDQIYTGSRVKPSITVTLDGKTLIAGTDYELEYDDNIIVGGQASVTAKGINNYTGWTTGYFNIVRGSSGPSSGDSQPSEDSSRGSDAPKDAPSTSGDTPTSHGDGNSIVMWRLYNPNSGEHFYTQSNSERDNVIGAGWTFEGEGWHAPTSGDPVYRLYNSRGGEHHYTLSAPERDSLVAAGWSYEGIGWYSDRDHSVPLYREYNPNQFSCNHNYTTSRSEHDHLVSLGWHDEGVGWYGI